MASVLGRDIRFAERGYGKNWVRLLYVNRNGPRHDICEIEVCTNLTLATTQDYVTGDNSDIIATDSQKNTVYVLAKQYGVKTIEVFALQLADHFLKTYPKVVSARISVEEKPWKRMIIDGQEHHHSFIDQSDGIRYCKVTQERNGVPLVEAGIRNLKILKTTKSAFQNFVRDKYRSLPDAPDRIFCTSVQSRWLYSNIRGFCYDKAWETAKATILEVFAGPPNTGLLSTSVQNTIYEAEKSVLEKLPQIEKIYIEMPNIHCYEFDFSKLPGVGIQFNNEVYQPTDKPSGNISAEIERMPRSKL